VGCTLSFEFITIIKWLGQWIVSHRLEVQFSKILAKTTIHILAKPFENDLKLGISHKHNRYFNLIPFFNGHERIFQFAKTKNNVWIQTLDIKHLLFASFGF
jgi:hypothetical protein